MTNTEMKVLEYLEAPYSRVVIPDPPSGTFAARIAEFPGCVAQGESVEETYRNLEEAAADWIRVALDLGQGIPTPFEDQTYSGRVLVRFPASIHRRAAELAERENTSLNQFVVSAVSERIGATNLAWKLLDRFQERLERSVSARCGAYFPTAWAWDTLERSDSGQETLFPTHLTLFIKQFKELTEPTGRVNQPLFLGQLQETTPWQR